MAKALMVFARTDAYTGSLNVVRLEVEGEPVVEVHLGSEAELSTLLGEIDGLPSALRAGAKKAGLI